MGTVLLGARLVLAAVFAVAGVAKLLDLAGSRRAMRDFGVPRPLAGPVGLALPLAELAVAVALLPAASAWWGALGALALLAAFVLGIGLSLARGRRPDCHCFGQLSSAPAGPKTLARNGVLAAVAAVVVWQGWSDPGPGALGWIGGLAMSETLLLALGLLALALLAGEAWLLAQLVSQNGRILLRLEALEQRLAVDAAHSFDSSEDGPGLPVGSQAPEFSLGGLHGETLTLGALRASGSPVLLAFMDPDCGPCNALIPEVARWQREQSGRLTLAVVSRGTAEANRAKASEHGIAPVLLQRDREVADRYQADGTPAAVLVRPDGTIGSAVALGADEIRALVSRATDAAVAALSAPAHAPAANGHAHAPAPPRASRVGQPAPAIRLPDLSGQQVDLDSFRGSATLVLFWNPSCGFCERMLPDLQRWEAHPPKGVPKLLVVSTGSVDANRALGLTAPVVLDPGFEVGRAFGASGTPSGVLVDAEGKLFSDVGVGAPGVWALLGGAPDPAGAG